MLRRFLSDTRGNYMLMTAAAIVPIMGGLAVAVDYTEMSRQRQLTLNALDAAGIATARRVIDGATDAELLAYAQDFFDANLGDVKPANTTLTVVLPNNNTGGGTLKLTANLKYDPYFIPAFSALMGDDGPATEISFDATSEIRLKNTLEVALVLDNSGSMDWVGHGSGQKRLTLLKSAAKDLVEKLADQAGQMKQVSKPVQFGVVPFAASVNVGTQYADASWMDTEGRSPIHHENFDWDTYSDPGTNKAIELQGGAYVKTGSDWEDEEGEVVTRFTLFDEMQRITGYGTKSVRKCSGSGWHRTCWTEQETDYDSPIYSPYASWQGCVEVRPVPYNRDDTPPGNSDPATFYVPMFAPDETDRTDGRGRSAMGNYWDDMIGGDNSYVRQKYTPKYFDGEPHHNSAAGPGEGPNASCTTKPITPLTDVTTPTGIDTIEDAIDAMQANGSTNVPEGIGWGWRVVSGGEPFTEGRPDSENGNDKVVIVLTDGENTYYRPDSLWPGYNDLANNKSVYSAFGYAGRNQPGESKSRLFTDTTVNSTDFSNDNYSAAMNEHMLATCGNAKDSSIIVMTVALDLSSSDTQQAAQISSLKECASESRFRRDEADPTKPAKLFWNATSGDLDETFDEIADELSNLRIVG